MNSGCYLKEEHSAAAVMGYFPWPGTVERTGDAVGERYRVRAAGHIRYRAAMPSIDGTQATFVDSTDARFELPLPEGVTSELGHPAASPTEAKAIRPTSSGAKPATVDQWILGQLAMVGSLMLQILARL